MLCPHVTLHDGQLLLPFSPSRCACFDCLRWIDPSGTGSHTFCCCCRYREGSRQAGSFLERGIYPLHSHQCGACRAQYSWIRIGSAVFLGIRHLRGRYKTTPNPFNKRFARYLYWQYSIHPESWGILEDDELHHVAWCKETSCATGWRWERLYRLWEGT